MRITLTPKELISIMFHLEYTKEKWNSDVDIGDLIQKLQNGLNKPITSTKRNATKKATYIRVDRAKDKIINAVNLMNLENEKITPYSVSKKANVSYNTVKKYEYLLISI